MTLADDWAIPLPVGPMPDLPGALCAETDPEAFYPDKGGSVRAAKRTCAACDLSIACLQWALDNGEVFGVWGGLTARERQKLTADAGPRPCRGCGGRWPPQDKRERYCSDECRAIGRRETVRRAGEKRRAAA